MPIYIYKHPEKEEYVEVFQGMNDEHSYEHEGVQWERQYTSPEISAHKITNPWDKNAFINETGSSKGTMGDLMDRSQELSNMRAKENGGIDPIKQKKFEDYSKLRGGLKDPLDPTRKKSFENKHVKVNLD